MDKKTNKMTLIVGISGATGAIYGIRLLQVLADMKDIETHLIISPVAAENIQLETEYTLKEVKALARYNYDIEDIGACLSSGSFKRDGMIIAPCSIKTLSAMANSYTSNLLIRAADVTLKERRKLVALVRETPLHLGHLKNMVALTEMGGIVMPPVPAFYHQPKTIQDIIDQTIGKVLDLFDIEHKLFQRWTGIDYQ
jgi:4-hydroxy-3-polyprenylbenzoate decarboxylase